MRRSSPIISGLPPERVRVIQGDTDLIATGTGTGGSSSIPCGGASVAGAAKSLPASSRTLPPTRSRRRRAISRSPTARSASPAPTARSRSPISRAVPQARRTRAVGAGAFTPEAATYPNGTHLAEVEIDPETGATRILNYVVVDDFGATLNPLLLAGQVHGGTVQGIGQALDGEHGL